MSIRKTDSTEKNREITPNSRLSATKSTHRSNQSIVTKLANRDIRQVQPCKYGDPHRHKAPRNTHYDLPVTPQRLQHRLARNASQPRGLATRSCRETRYYYKSYFVINC